jgi:hypothetical protein
VTVAAERYEIRVKGKLNKSVRSAFRGMSAATLPPETVLTGCLEDQSALYGVLARVHALGLELVEIRRVAPASEAAEPNDPVNPHA